MSYNNITLYDGQTVNYLLVIDHTLTEDEKNIINTNEYEPSWTDFDDIIILSPYNDNIHSSYLRDMGLNVAGYTVYRQKIGENTLHKVDSVYYESNYIIDYLVSNKQTYRWYVFPYDINATYYNPLVTDDITTNWNSWTISFLAERYYPHTTIKYYTVNDVWTFKMSIGSKITGDAIIQNRDVTYHKNYSEYPKVSIGDSNYLTGSFTCLLGNVDNLTYKYNDSIEKIKAWEKAVNSKNPVLIKDPKGRIIFAMIDNNTSSQYIDAKGNPVSITVSFTEIGDTENMSVCYYEDNSVG